MAKAIGLPNHDDMAGEVTVWLPNKNNPPVPSSPLAGDMPRARPRIQPWRAPVIRLDTAAAAAFLQRCQEWPVLQPGVALGPEIAYWYRAHLFGLSLATRQQYPPTVAAHGDQSVAAWKPSSPETTPNGWPIWPADAAVGPGGHRRRPTTPLWGHASILLPAVPPPPWGRTAMFQPTTVTMTWVSAGSVPSPAGPTYPDRP